MPTVRPVIDENSGAEVRLSLGIYLGPDDVTEGIDLYKALAFDYHACYPLDKRR